MQLSEVACVSVTNGIVTICRSVQLDWKPTTGSRAHAVRAEDAVWRPRAGPYGEGTTRSNLIREESCYSRDPVEIRARRSNPSARPEILTARVPDGIVSASDTRARSRRVTIGLASVHP